MTHTLFETVSLNVNEAPDEYINLEDSLESERLAFIESNERAISSTAYMGDKAIQGYNLSRLENFVD